MRQEELGITNGRSMRFVNAGEDWLIVLNVPSKEKLFAFYQTFALPTTSF